MTASAIIKEIKRLPPNEQAQVVRFACQLDSERRLTGNELSGLAGRMAYTEDAAEAGELREEIVKGFYGTGFRG